ncbi:MAG: 16S rRNA (cytosine(1402)-N(4))-methyltransferase RsmH [Planctomycetes bacterium]|nr:16S rRNA (cytosine(1402)-N(4))-methyltransferase RsmH [Planctomycetota bacterium]
MTDPDPKPPRRPRYPGTHPRRFEQKYKELAPEKYPELVEHVRERGMTPAGQHVPILVEEVLAVLAPRPGERGVDCTLGYGGHARRFLERLAPEGTLLGLDVDPLELEKTEARLRALGFGPDALVVRRTNFAGLGAAVFGLGWSDGADFVFADLGVSSMQIDDPSRGFTFKADGPLDMRMHPGKGLSAAEWLARTTREELERALVEHADEPHAERLASALWLHNHELTTTRALVEAVRRALPPRLDEEETTSSIRRVFQALRIQVNDEFGALEALLRQLPACVRPGGRAALLTFHSGEDRRVKHAFAAGVRDGVWSEVNDEVVRASAEERRANPRSAPAKLRWVRRGGAPA